MGDIPLLWLVAGIACVCGATILERFCKWPLEKRGTTRGVLTMLTGYALFSTGGIASFVYALAFLLSRQ